MITVNSFPSLTIITKRSILDVAAAIDSSLKLSSRSGAEKIRKKKYWHYYLIIYLVICEISYLQVLECKSKISLLPPF